MDEFMKAAIEEAKLGLQEGGIPIGSVLVIDGKIVGRGHNRRVQKGSAILHAEMDCIENAGRLKAKDYQRAVLYSTLSRVICAAGLLCYIKFQRLSLARTKRFKDLKSICARGVWNWSY
jgi:cytosine deaminase